MIGWLQERVYAFRGRGAHAPTVPPMDGALRPNTLLQDARVVARITAPDNLTQHGGRVLFSSGNGVQSIDPNIGLVKGVRSFDAPVTAMASLSGVLAIALQSGKLILSQQGGAERVIDGIGGKGQGITALSPGAGNSLLVCVGSAVNGPEAWKHDLMQFGRSGSVWSVSLADGKAAQLAGELSWPGGVIAAGQGVVVAESWRHRLVAFEGKALRLIVTDLPGYPSRIIASPQGGFWLAVFAPRNQLIELVLREKPYRERMMREVDPAFWVAPSLSPARSFYEPMQGGAIRTHGIVKPWAPTRSYGLLVRLDAAFQPIASYHSRADGAFHGVTSAIELDGQVLVTSKGGDAIMSLSLDAGALS
jgi:hypothetical protein